MGTARRAGHGWMSILSPLALLGYRRYWLATTVSVVGDQFQLVALAVLVLDLTGSAAALGTVVLVQAVPSSLLMLVGGVATDRLHPRTVLLGAHALQGLLVAGVAALVAADRLTLWHLYAFAATFGAVHAFVVPAVGTITPDLVPGERVRGANALTQTTGQLARALVPPVAGGMVALSGTAVAFAVNAASFLTSAAMLRGLPVGERTAAPTGSALEQLREGVRAAQADRVVWSTILCSTVFFFGQAAATVAGLPALAKLELGAGDAGVGILYGALGAGALLGAVAAGSLGVMPRQGLVAYGLTVVAGLAIVGAGAAPSVAAAVPLLALSGVAYSVSGLIFLGLVQTRTPPAVRGRVMSVLALGMVGLTPLSYAAVGLGGEWLTARGVVVGGGVVMVAWGLLGLSRWEVRQAG